MCKSDDFQLGGVLKWNIQFGILRHPLLIYDANIFCGITFRPWVYIFGGGSFLGNIGSISWINWFHVCCIGYYLINRGIYYEDDMSVYSSTNGYQGVYSIVKEGLHEVCKRVIYWIATNIWDILDLESNGDIICRRHFDFLKLRIIVGGSCHYFYGTQFITIGYNIMVSLRHVDNIRTSI